METAGAVAPKTRARHRLRFGIGRHKARKGAGFRASTGECRDTRTGWLGGLDSNHRDAVDLL